MSRCITVELLRDWRAGHPHAEQTVYRILRTRYLALARSVLHDAHEAQTGFHDAFLRMKAAVSNGFVWRSERETLAFFRQILERLCYDYYRREKNRLQQEERYLGITVPPDEETGLEAIEQAIGQDPHNDEQAAHRRELFSQELQALLETFTRRDRQLWEAYSQVAYEHDYHPLTKHQWTKLVQARLGWPQNVFYIAHHRFLHKLERFGLRWKLCIPRRSRATQTTRDCDGSRPTTISEREGQAYEGSS